MFPVTDFVDYVFEFYGPRGLYPMPRLTRSAVSQTVQVYLSIVGRDNFAADSLDRERVRDILLLKYNCPALKAELV
jgi:hypothetical protein